MTGPDNNKDNDDRVYAKSADDNGDKEPLAEHSIHDIEVCCILVAKPTFIARRTGNNS